MNSDKPFTRLSAPDLPSPVLGVKPKSRLTRLLGLVLKSSYLVFMERLKKVQNNVSMRQSVQEYENF